MNINTNFSNKLKLITFSVLIVVSVLAISSALLGPASKKSASEQNLNSLLSSKQSINWYLDTQKTDSLKLEDFEVVNLPMDQNEDAEGYQLFVTLIKDGVEVYKNPFTIPVIRSETIDPETGQFKIVGILPSKQATVSTPFVEGNVRILITGKNQQTVLDQTELIESKPIN